MRSTLILCNRKTKNCSIDRLVMCLFFPVLGHVRFSIVISIQLLHLCDLSRWSIQILGAVRFSIHMSHLNEPFGWILCSFLVFHFHPDECNKQITNIPLFDLIICLILILTTLIFLFSLKYIYTEIILKLAFWHL